MARILGVDPGSRTTGYAVMESDGTRTEYLGSGCIRAPDDTLAVRITAHPASRQLCDAWGGPLVSTSANRGGANPCRSPLCVVRQLGDSIHFLLHAPLGGRKQPTEIRDGLSGRLLRAA